MVFFREIRPRSNTTCFEIMHKFLLLSLLFFIPHFHLSAQDIKRSSADTSVINLQM